METCTQCAFVKASESDEGMSWSLEIDGEDGELFQARSGELVDDDGGWLAPIPSPAVCEAVARYAEAYINGLPRAWTSAETSLLSAIRAEVDGAA